MIILKIFWTITALQTEIEEREAVEKFIMDMIKKGDKDEALRAHYREGEVVNGVWVNHKEEE